MVKILKNRVNGWKVKGKLKLLRGFYVPATLDLSGDFGFFIFFLNYLPELPLPLHRRGNRWVIAPLLCKEELEGVVCYFVGIAAKVAFKNSQNLFTDSMFTFSSGE